MYNLLMGNELIQSAWYAMTMHIYLF